jgi:hypothetical protein
MTIFQQNLLTLVLVVAFILIIPLRRAYRWWRLRRLMGLNILLVDSVRKELKRAGWTESQSTNYTATGDPGKRTTGPVITIKASPNDAKYAWEGLIDHRRKTVSRLQRKLARARQRDDE